MQMFLNGAMVKADMNDSLTRAVVISLFSWRRADNGDVYDGANLQGWWGDTFADDKGDRIGSKLWQLLRRKLTDEVIAEAEEDVREALQWLIDDGVCSDITVLAERSDTDRLNISVDLNVIGRQNKKYRFEEL